MEEGVYSIGALFAGKDAVALATYHRLIEALHALGPFQEQPKKTSIHLAHTSGFAGVHPRKSFLYLTVRMERRIESPRVVKVEQVSKNRYHNDIKLASPDEVDAELLGWLREAYGLG
jgi:hypothetical protein